jgi:hypothetical protein
VNISDIEASLPWGLHDSYLEAIEIDWPKARLTLTVRVMMSENQDMDQRAKVVLSGLAFCTFDPPEIDATHGYEPTPACGLWVDTGKGAANADAKRRLPAVPEGGFLHWFFVHQWNSFIHVCARDAKLIWLEAAPAPARAETRAMFPGDEIPEC